MTSLGQVHKKREELETGLLGGLAGLALQSLQFEQKMTEATQAKNHELLHNEQIERGGDDMQIVLGDITTTNEAPKPNKGSSLLKAALGAGLIATGAGLATGGPLILDAIRDLKGETVIQREEGPRYLLDLGDPVTGRN